MVATEALPFILATATISAQQWTPVATENCPDFYRQKNPQHTACKPPNSWCKIKDRSADDAQRALILKLHNEYRSRVARGNVTGFKPAADMQEVLWYPDLEYVAQVDLVDANLCTTPNGDLKHDNVHDRFTPRFEQVGENLAWRGRAFSNDGPNWTYVILGWFSEYKLFPANLVSRLQVLVGVKTGHFTQYLWTKSRYVGCVYVYYTVYKARYPYMKLYACDYGPAGNYLRRAVYREGSTRSACPPPTQCDRRSGLCDGTSRDPDLTTPYLRPRTPGSSQSPTPLMTTSTPSSPPSSHATVPPITSLSTEPSIQRRSTDPPTRHEPITEPLYVLDPDLKLCPIPEPDDARPTSRPSADTIAYPSVPSRPSIEIGDGSPAADSDVAAYRGVEEEGTTALPFIVGCITAVGVATLATYFIFCRCKATIAEAT
ncbi:hypothetical protein HPB52_001063 [Rhipicephalus sanguineus]|uniref:SCP domain-containing protein n=1 Tax=Rhipicephalus sanguineus TaxID=34632 RepID=A0A9D4SX84_RHISA|nr:hypothetical protein HPB52_001063 [Rhipicephalus sanguineus]